MVLFLKKEYILVDIRKLNFLNWAFLLWFIFKFYLINMSYCSNEKTFRS